MSEPGTNIGRTIADRYRLEELLGRGGFGEVYRGRDMQLERDVAVKLVDVRDRRRSKQQTTDLRARFRREAQAAARIDHPCVVTIHDFGIPDDGHEAHLVMQYLVGQDLSHVLLGSGPMLPDRALSLFVPLLEGLGRGHEQGIVHKDIKPQNIFVVRPAQADESLCLVDFGVARILHEDKLTLTGLIVGTPQYMAPEYITEALVSPALDVYQMALMLVETIVGRPAAPAGESFVRTCNRHFTGQLHIPKPLLTGDIGDVLKAALAVDPNDRIPDAAEFARRLAAVDPATIVFEQLNTMRYERPAPRALPPQTEPPMFRTMTPQQVTDELQRMGPAHGTEPVELPITTPRSQVTEVVQSTQQEQQDMSQTRQARVLLVALGLFSILVLLSVVGWAVLRSVEQGRTTPTPVVAPTKQPQSKTQIVAAPLPPEPSTAEPDAANTTTGDVSDMGPDVADPTPLPPPRLVEQERKPSAPSASTKTSQVEPERKPLKAQKFTRPAVPDAGPATKWRREFKAPSTR